jgi:hypothetical protein
MSATADPQTSIWEKEITNDALEKALERRDELIEPKKAAAKAYKSADDAVKALLENEELGIGSVVRVGRFLITKTHREGGKPVEFETSPQDRYSIKLFEAEDS